MVHNGLFGGGGNKEERRGRRGGEIRERREEEVELRRNVEMGEEPRNQGRRERK